MKRLVSVFCVSWMIVAVFPIIGNATIRYVNAAATGANNGTSWADAYTSLQTAIIAAVSGDEIWVVKGLYKPAAAGNPMTSFPLKSRVSLYGHFAGTETAVSQRDLNNSANKTVLSGDIDNNDTTDAQALSRLIPNIQGINSYHVVYADGSTTSIGNDTVLDGFTITSGYANGGGGWNNGSGLYCIVSVAGKECSPTIRNIIFTGNMCGGSGGAGAMFNLATAGTVNTIVSNVTFSNNGGVGGGGMANLGANPTLTNVNFFNNHTSYCGGGMGNQGSKPTLINVTFSGNSSDGNGGGMYNDNKPKLTNVTFTNNSSATNGGAIYNYGESGGNSSPELTNVIFSGNKANFGGAIVNDGYAGNASPTLTNVIFSGNMATSAGGAMYSDGNAGGISIPVLKNVIMWGNSAVSGSQITNRYAHPNISYSLIQGGISGSGVYNTGGASITDGGGNIDADPLFVNPIPASSAPTTAGDYHLQFLSPAINAGNNAAVAAVTTDLDGKPRIWEGTVDMGAYERQSVSISIVSVSNISAATALATASVSGNDNSERGFFWWTDAGFTSGTVAAGYGAGAGDFSLTLSNLQPLTTYQIRAYIRVGSQLISSDNSLTFTTTSAVPPVFPQTPPSAVVNGRDVTFELSDIGTSPITVYGFVYNTKPAPTVWDTALPLYGATFPGSFTGTIRNLTPGVYYLRPYAHSTAGTSYGTEISFTIVGPGFSVTPVSGITTESGSTAAFQVKLNTAPTADVSISFSSSKITEGTVSPANLTFTPLNWDISQTVTVTGADDNEVDGEQTFRITFSPVISDDSAYNGLKPDDLTLINTDNDVANHTPLGNADNYQVNQDSPLNITAPGVLANDTDADNDSLTAIKISDPAKGTLVLNINGSFIYTPGSGFYGNDSFTYKANDGKTDSAATSVTITVNYVQPYIPPYIPPVIIPDQPPVVVEPEKPPVVVEPEKPPVIVEPEKPPVIVEPEKPPVIVEPEKPPVVAEPEKPPVITQPETPNPVTPGQNVAVPKGPVALNLPSAPKNDTEKIHWVIKEENQPDGQIHDITDKKESQYVIKNPDQGMKYIWQVGYEDSAGNISWSPEYSFVTGDQGTEHLNIGAGTEYENFRAVAFTLWEDDPSFRSTLSPIMGVKLDRENYRITAYDNRRKAFSDYGTDEFQVKPGHAYWFLARNGLKADFRGVPVSLQKDIQISLDYSPGTGNGWNFIAAPNKAGYPWEDIEVVVYDGGNIVFGPAAVGRMSFPNSYIDNRLWRWENGAYSADTAVIIKNTGYWVKAKTSGVFLIFPVKSQIVSNPADLRRSRKVVAESEESPPMPVSGFADKSKDIDLSGGGCFIGTIID